MLGNCPPSGAPPRPLWKEGSRPRGPPQRSQSAGRIGTEAGRQRLPLGAAPVKHRGRGSHLRAQRAVGGHIPPSPAWWFPGTRALRGRVVRRGLGPAYLVGCSCRVSRRSRPQFPLKRPGELASAVTSGAAAARASPRRRRSARREDSRRNVGKAAPWRRIGGAAETQNSLFTLMSSVLPPPEKTRFPAPLSLSGVLKMVLNRARQGLCFHEDLYLRGGDSVQGGKYTNKVISNAWKTNKPILALW